MHIADEVHKATNNKQFTLSVMIDLEKAFDLVWSKGLLYKMEQRDIHGNVLNIVEDFLKNRSIQVLVEAAMSNTYFHENGTPHCSVLSQLLFIIMTNDLPKSSNGVKHAPFAGDSSMRKSAPNLCDLHLHRQEEVVKHQLRPRIIFDSDLT